MVRVIVGDAARVLPELAAESVHMASRRIRKDAPLLAHVAEDRWRPNTHPQPGDAP